MMHITKLFILISIIAAIIMPGTSSFAGDDILITQEELAGIIGKPGVVIVDARGEKSYNKKHLPGAVNMSYILLVTLRDEATIKNLAVPLPPEKAETKGTYLYL